MRTLRLHALVFCLVIAFAGCGRGSKSDQVTDDSDQEITTTKVPATAPAVVPTPVPTPTPTPFPSSNTWSQTGQMPIGGTVAQEGWSPFNGWPYNQGYPQNYQQSTYAQYPDFSSYGSGYYIATMTSLYRSVLGRNPDLPGLQFWMRELIAGRPFTSVREEFLRSPEVTAIGNANHVQDVIALYRVFLGRLPEQGGLQAWVGQLASGVPLNQVARSFSGSPEYVQYGGYGQSLFSRAVVDLFKNHLGRFGQYNELAGWLSNVAAGNSYAAAINVFRATQEAQSLGGLNAENCIAVHRIIRGKLPPRSEVTRCTARGTNTTGSPYNPALQAYAQELMTSSNHCGGSPYCPL